MLKIGQNRFGETWEKLAIKIFNFHHRTPNFRKFNKGAKHLIIVFFFSQKFSIQRRWCILGIFFVKKRQVIVCKHLGQCFVLMALHRLRSRLSLFTFCFPGFIFFFYYDDFWDPWVWFSRELRSVWTCLSFQFQMRNKEREICEFEMDLNNLLFALYWLCNDNIISA